jgi:hypothetical protein
MAPHAHARTAAIDHLQTAGSGCEADTSHRRIGRHCSLIICRDQPSENAGQIPVRQIIQTLRDR